MAATGPGQRELRLKLKFESEARNTSQAFKDMASHAEKIDKHMAAAARSAGGTSLGGAAGPSALLARSTASSATFQRPIPVVIVGQSPAGGMAGGRMPGGSGGGSSSFGGFRGAAAGVAGVAAGVSTAAGMATAFMDIGDASTTARQKVLAFADAIPLIGSSISGVINQIMTLQDRLADPEGWLQRKENARNHPLNMARDSSAFGFREGAAALGRDGRSLRYEADAARLFPTASSQDAKGRMAAFLSGKEAPKTFTAAEAIASANRGMNLAQGPGPMMKDARFLAAEDGIQAAKRGLYVAQQEDSSARADANAAARRAADARRASEKSDFRASSMMGELTGPGGDALNSAYSGGDQATYYRLSRNAGMSKIRSAFKSMSGPVRDFFGIENGAEVKRGLMDRQDREVDPSRPIVAGMLPTNRDPTKVVDAYLDAERKLGQAQRENAAAIEATNRSREKANDLARKQLDLSRAEQELQKAKVQILEEQEQKLRGQASAAKSAAEQFAMFDPMKQKDTLEALKMFQKGGRNALSGDQFDLLQGSGLTGDFVKDKLGSQVTSSEYFKQILAITGQKDQKTLEAEANKIAMEKVTIKSQVDVQFQFDEQKLTQTLLQTFERALEKALQQLRQKESVVKNQMEIRTAIGRLQQ